MRNGTTNNMRQNGAQQNTPRTESKMHNGLCKSKTKGSKLQQIKSRQKDQNGRKQNEPDLTNAEQEKATQGNTNRINTNQIMPK